LPYEIIDRLLGLESAQLLTRYTSGRRKALRKDAAKSAGVSDRKPNTKRRTTCPTMPVIVSTGYGRIRIGVEQDRLTFHNRFTTPSITGIMKFPGACGSAEPRTHACQFQSDLSGDIASLTRPSSRTRADFFHDSRPARCANGRS
jgi:hypothetical protein